MTASPVNKLIDSLLRWRGRWAVLALLIVAALGSDLWRSLDFDTSLDSLLSRSDPYLVQRQQFQAQFPSELTVSFAFLPSPDAPGGVFSPATLAALAQLQAECDTIPFARHCSTLLSYFSPQRQRRLFPQPYTEYGAAGLAQLRQEALADTLLSNSLLSAEASLTFGRVVVGEETEGKALSPQQRLAVAEAAIALRDRLREAHPDIAIHVNSEVILEQASRRAMLDDLSVLLPLVILVCITAMGICFRSFRLAVCILCYMLATLVATLGTLGLLGIAFNSISVIAPLVVMIIAVANSVHIISIYLQRQNERNIPALQVDSQNNLRESLQENLRPVTLAALTTAIGFSSLQVSSSPAIQDFGRIVAIGIGFAYLLVFTLLPALLLRLRPTTANSHQHGRHERHASHEHLRTALKWLDGFVQRQDTKLFRGYSVFALFTLALLPLNETDFNRLDFIPADSGLQAYYEVVNEHTGRGYTLTYAIDSGRIDGAIEPAFLQQITAYTDALGHRITSAASVVDVIKTVNRFQHQDDPAYYTLPDDIDTIGFYLSNYELAESQDFPLSAFINHDFSMITLFLSTPPLSNQGVLDLDAQITQAFDEHFGGQFTDAELIHGSGLLLFARMDERVTVELLQGYCLSLLLITLSLAVGLRSVYFGVLSVLPNLLPATMVFGMWALLSGQLDPFVMMLFSISIGLVVDDTVHILSHYLRARSARAVQEAISHAIATAGPALTITTLILALGTTLLIAADTIYFQQAAKLLVPIVVLALVLDLTYLPAILKRFDRRPVRLPR